MVALHPSLVLCLEHGRGGRRPWACPLCPPKVEPVQSPVVRVTSCGGQRAGQAAEDALWAGLESAGLAKGAEKQLRWHPTRRYRADIGYRSPRLLVEVCGMAHAAGRRRVRYDIERTGEAAALGWRVLTVTPEQVKSGRAVELVRLALTAGGSGS